MKLKHLFPFSLMSLITSAHADEVISQNTSGTLFHFSTEVRRTVEKDLMEVNLSSRKTGKNLPELKQAVSSNLNQVLALAKQAKSIDVQADGVNNYLNYDQKNKVQGWIAEGRIYLKSKDFEAMTKVLEQLGENIAVEQIAFKVSPEKMASLEDEMTLEIIKQFQHKAEVIQKGLNAKGFKISNINLETPNGEGNGDHMMLMAKSAYESEPMPIEVGKETISARASGEVKIE